LKTNVPKFCRQQKALHPFDKEAENWNNCQLRKRAIDQSKMFSSFRTQLAPVSLSEQTKLGIYFLDNPP
jgi:hypothetical protein